MSVKSTMSKGPKLIIMRLFLYIVGLLCFAVALTLVYSTDLDLFRIVRGAAYNHIFSRLGAVAWAVIGTGFIVMAGHFKPTLSSDEEIKRAKALDKLEDALRLFDLGVISKEEYDEVKQELMPIIKPQKK